MKETPSYLMQYAKMLKDALEDWEQARNNPDKNWVVSADELVHRIEWIISDIEYHEGEEI